MRLGPLLVPLLVAGVFALTPVGVEAATANFFGPIITPACECPESAPDWGCVLQTFQNVINLGVSLTTIFFVLIAAYAGVMLMANPTNPSNRGKAKTMLLNVVIGLFIALSAWLLVDFVMRALYNETGEFGPWNTILAENSARTCIVEQTPPAAIGAGDGGEVVTQPGGNQGEDQFAVGSRVACRESGQGTAQPGTVTAVQRTNSSISSLSVRFDDNTTRQSIPVADCQLYSGNAGSVTVELGPNAVVSQNAIAALKTILSSAGISSALITSGKRTSADQARIMYDNIVAHGAASQKALYGSAGDQVIDVYIAQNQAGASATQIRSAMQQKIDQIGCLNVSRHCSTRDVIDVAPSSIPDNKEDAFRAAIRNSNAVSHYIFPPADPAFHIEF